MSDKIITSKEALTAAMRRGFQPEFLFFWGHHPSTDGQIRKQCLSQWYAASFTVDGITYPTTEHFMMAEKARLFGDTEICEKVLSSPTPENAKQLGRQVKNFNAEIWYQHRFEIIVRGNEAKFGQNQPLKKFLLETKEKILVEASPYDTIWGIGWSENDPGAADPEKWRGLNLLGFALMVVRSRLSDPV
jgi:ribA/ribD-fused uncharacterized protein